MRGVATLDDFAHAGACALSNAGAGSRIITAGSCNITSGSREITSSFLLRLACHTRSRYRQVCAPQRYYIDDVIVMNIIKMVKISLRVWPDQLKNASAVPE